MLFEIFAKIAQLVEHDLAKVGVAGSSPVFRSCKPDGLSGFFYFYLRFSEIYYSFVLLKILFLLSIKE